MIDWDYWRNKNPVFPEDAVIWFTDGSRASSGTGSSIVGLGNEESDKLARQVSAMPLLGPEQALGIPKCSAREAIKNWTEHQHYSAWKDLPGLRHGKLFIADHVRKELITCLS